MNELPYWVIEQNFLVGPTQEDDLMSVFVRETCPHVLLPANEIHRVTHRPVMFMGKPNRNITYDTWTSEWFNLELISKNLKTLYAYHDHEIMTLEEVNALTVRNKLVFNERVYVTHNDPMERDLFAFKGERKIDHQHWGTYPMDTKVWVSSPKTTFAKYMCVVVLGEIAAYSRVELNDEFRPRAFLPNSARTVVDHLNQFYQPAPVYVMTIVDTKNGWLVEDYRIFNHHRKFYDCDLRAVVQGINDCYPSFSKYELPKMRPLIEEAPSNKAVEPPSKAELNIETQSGSGIDIHKGGVSVHVDVPPGVQVIKGENGEGVTLEQMRKAGIPI